MNRSRPVFSVQILVRVPTIAIKCLRIEHLVLGGIPQRGMQALDDFDIAPRKSRKVRHATLRKSMRVKQPCIPFPSRTILDQKCCVVTNGMAELIGALVSLAKTGTAGPYLTVRSDCSQAPAKPHSEERPALEGHGSGRRPLVQVRLGIH